MRKVGPPKLVENRDLGNGNVAQVYLFDEFGLALDPKAWAKPSCNHCLGRGFVWKFTQRDVERTVEGKTTVTREPHREMAPCGCGTNKYNKVKHNTMKRLLKAHETGGDAAAACELELIHRELGGTTKIKAEELPKGTPLDKL